MRKTKRVASRGRPASPPQRPASRPDVRYQSRTFASWDEFKHGLFALLTGGESGHPAQVYKRYVFRGQRDAAWPLRSSFDRKIGPKRAAKRDALAKRLIDDFYIECERYSSWRYTRDDARVLAMAQHHGLPTRLLDWSFSPYVAAYFAYSFYLFEQASAGDGHVAIWALNCEDVKRRAPEGQLEIVSIQDFENSRLGNQAGAFTYLKTNEDCLEDYLASPAVGLNSALIKFELPRSEAPNALRDLILMGIHHGTIFPGREGVAQMIWLRHVLESADPSGLED
jgi:hypothetical protein